MDPSKLITPDEAAVLLGITGNRVRQLIRKGRLPAQKVRNRWPEMRAGDIALIKNRKGGRPRGVPQRKFDLVVPIGKPTRKG